MRLHLFSAALLVLLSFSFSVFVQAATPPALSSPNSAPEAHLGAEYFGNLSGAASVGSSGNASYIIPLELPPGTHSMVPNLSLNYHSDVKNGFLGVGWFVEGLTSKINRCPQTIAQDGQSKAVDLSSDDKFCLDGHRLVAQGGTYGAPGTTYRTESDEFSRITSYGGTTGNPDYWVVERKDGITLTFGATADGKMEAPGASSTVVWCLEKVEDELGNYFEYSFDRPFVISDADDSYLRTTRIDYTANDSEGLSAYASVQFEYETRDDVQTRYSLSGPITTDKRISNIKTYLGTTLVKDYQLTYEYGVSTGQSRLIELEACSDLGDCTQITSFVWADESVNPIDNRAPISLPSGKVLAIADFKGDGYKEILHLNGGTNASFLRNNSNNGYIGYHSRSPVTYNLTENARIHTGDFNGDRRVDILSCPDDQNLSRWCNLLHADTNGTFPTKNQQFQWHSHLGIDWRENVFVGDVNGDGKADVVALDDDKLKTVFADQDGKLTSIAQETLVTGADEHHWHTGDFNGDGLLDFFAQGHTSADQHLTYISDGAGGFISQPTISLYSASYQWTLDYGRKLFFGDFNGDNRTDIVFWAGYLNNEEARKVLLADEYGHFSVNSEEYTFTLGSGVDKTTFHVSDFNGDGLDDIYGQTTSSHSNATNFMMLANLDSPFSHTEQTWSKNYDLGYWSTFYGYNSIVDDFNSDGRADIFTQNLSNLSQRVLYWSHENEAIPDQLITATDGLGNVTTFEYKPLTDSSVYTKGSGAVYPEQDYQNARYVVSELRQSNGIGGESTVTYTYEGAKVNLEGRGDLGFAKMTSTNQAQNRTTITEYKQGFPYSGFPEKVEVYRTSDNMLLSSVETTYGGHVEPLQGTIFPYVDNRIEKAYDPLSGLLLSTTTTTNHCDEYGNITDTTVVTEDHLNGDTFESKTINTFNIDTTNWRVGQKVSQTTENKLNSINDPSLNLTTTYTYDTNGQLSSSTRGSGLGNSIELTTSYAYDGFGNVISETVSGSGITSRTSSTTWDSRGQFPATMTNALGHTESRLYDDRFGVITSQTGPNGLTTTWLYNDFGQMEQELRPDGSSTQTFRHLDTSSSLSNSSYYHEVLMSGAPPSRTFYDSLGRTLRSRTQGFDGSYINTDTEYDSRGRTLRTSEPYFDGGLVSWNTPSYDDSNRTVGLVAADTVNDATTSYTGFSVTVTDAGGRTRTTHSNAVGQVIEVIDDLGTSTEFTYNQNGVRTSAINASGTAFESTVTYTVDVLGRTTAQDDPDHGIYTYTYDALGQKLTEISPKMASASQSMTFTYDLLGRMLTRTEPEGTTTWDYDNTSGGNLGLGKLHSESMTGYSRTYEYDSLGSGKPTKVTTVIGSNTYISQTDYDSIGRVETATYPASTSYPSGLEIENTYNALGYLERVQNVNASDVYYQFLDSDERGQMTQQWLGDGSTLTQAYEDHSARITSQSTDTSSTSIQHFTYIWDNVGNMTSRTDVGAAMTESFTYDDLDRLTSAQVGAATPIDFDFDIVGNVTEKSDVGDYSYLLNQPHAVSSITQGGSSNSYNYDANGNMDSSSDLPSSTWTSYNKPSQISQGGITYNFSYGTDRARYKKVHSTSSTTTTTHYLGDMEVVYGTTTSYRHLIRAGGAVIAVLTDTGTESIEYLHRDHLGSITAITDDTGAVQERLAYDAWGLRRDATDWDGSATTTELRGFTGHEHLDDIGIIHMNGRVYSPKLGRFLSPDPVTQFPENGQNYNKYSYVDNNPLKYTDPSGYRRVPWRGNYDGMGSNNAGFGGFTGLGGFWGLFQSTAEYVHRRPRINSNVFVINPQVQTDTPDMTPDATPNELVSDGSASTLDRAQATLERLRQIPEFAAIEEQHGALNIVVNNSIGTRIIGNTISLNESTFSTTYDIDIQGSLNAYQDSLPSDLSDEEYFSAIDAYEGSLQTTHGFSMERVLVHEAYHLTQPSSLEYSLFQGHYENQAIQYTNEFMFEHFDEPYRKY